MKKQGYRAYAIKGGYLAWYRAGYPISRKQATAAVPLKTICPDCGEPVESHSHETD